MHYFIDGYNLLFRLMYAEDSFQNQRELIIQDLNKKIALLKLDASLVFDATFQTGERSRYHFDALEILFTAEGETADEYILDELQTIKQPRQQIVVTSDKKLAWLVRRQHAQTESVEDFMARINRAYKKKQRLFKQKTCPPPSSLIVSTPIASNDPVDAIIAPVIFPMQDLSTANSLVYYQTVFEAEWQEIQIQEEEYKKHKRLDKQKTVPRHPKKQLDPFSIPSTPRPKTATEMERWLQVFEERVSRDVNG